MPIQGLYAQPTKRRLCYNRRAGWSFALLLCLAFVRAATAQAPPPFCGSLTFTPNPLLIPVGGGVFTFSLITDTSPFCLCVWGGRVSIPFSRAVGGGVPFKLRGGAVENPSACIYDVTREYFPNDGPSRTGTAGASGQAEQVAPDFSNAMATIQVIQEGVAGGGGTGAGGVNSSLSAIFARDDFVVAYRDTVLSYAVLGNDAAIAGLDRGSIRIVEQGQNGTATVNDDETVSYTSRPGVVGEDTFTYTVMDVNGLESNVAKVTVDAKDEPPFTGCAFSRPNHHLHFHHPALYLGAVRQIFNNQPLELAVQVLKDGLPVGEGVPARISSSKPVFPGDSVLPESSVASGQTMARGVAMFVVNPPKPNPTDRIDLTASVVIDGANYSCRGTLVVGLGSRLRPYVDVLDGLADPASGP